MQHIFLENLLWNVCVSKSDLRGLKGRKRVKSKVTEQYPVMPVLSINKGYTPAVEQEEEEEESGEQDESEESEEPEEPEEEEEESEE